jgi:exonuclease SbcD
MSLGDLDVAINEIVRKNITDLATEAQEKPNMPAVLAAHFSVSGATQGSEQSVMIGRDVVVFKDLLANTAWDYVALGHIHKHQELNGGQHPPIVYSGSLERIDFGEEREQKGFVIAEIEHGRSTWEFYPLDARRFLTIRIDVTSSDDPMTDIFDKLETYIVDEAIVRVIIKAEEAQDVLLDDKAIRQALQGAAFIASIVHDVARTHRHRLGVGSTEELTPQELLELYLDTKNTPADVSRNCCAMLRLFSGKQPGNLCVSVFRGYSSTLANVIPTCF